MKIKHVQAVTLSGFIWISIGFFLLFKGLHYILFATVFHSSTAPLLSLFGQRGNGGIFLIALGVAIGYAKGKFVFPRTVNRVVKRILEQTSPFPLKNLYSKGYFILIGSMMLLGMLMKVSKLPFDIRGVVDTAVGTALIIGSFAYFKQAMYLAARAKKQKGE